MKAGFFTAVNQDAPMRPLLYFVEMSTCSNPTKPLNFAEDLQDQIKSASKTLLPMLTPLKKAVSLSDWVSKWIRTCWPPSAQVFHGFYFVLSSTLAAEFQACVDRSLCRFWKQLRNLKLFGQFSHGESLKIVFFPPFF